MHPFIARARRLAGYLPGVTVEPWWGGRQEALKVGGKAMANTCRYDDALAVFCPLETKAVLVAAAPEFYYDTDHFRPWPAVLVRMAAIDDATLAARLEQAWRDRAPRRLVTARDRERGGKQNGA